MTLSQNGRPSPLDELYEYAKNKGTITYQEVTDRLGNTFFEADQLEKVLDKLESLGVTVVDSAEIPDASPAAMEVPDPALNDDLSEADVISADDPVRMYLKEIERRPRHPQRGETPPERSEPAPCRVDCQEVRWAQQELHEPARPDSGGQPRSDEGSGEVRLHQGLQVLHLRDMVDSAGYHPLDCRSGAYHPHPRAHGGNN